MRHYFVSVLVLFFIQDIIQGQEVEPIEPALDVLLTFTNSRDFTLSSNQDEAYFTLQSPLGDISIIAFSKKENGKWKKPEMAGFSGSFMDLEPFLSPDNLRLYFASNRPLDGSASQADNYDIWFVERKSTDSSWSKPVNLGAPVNSRHNEFYPSVSVSGNLYFTSDSPNSKGKDDIFFSALKDEKYSQPVSISDSINTEGYEFNAFISPKEKYIIYSGYNRNDGLGSGDLYISYRKEDGTWGSSKNLGEKINSKYMDYCPFVDEKSNILYFTSRRSSIEYNDFKSIEDFLKEINKTENGFSRIYKIKFERE